MEPTLRSVERTGAPSIAMRLTDIRAAADGRVGSGRDVDRSAADGRATTPGGIEVPSTDSREVIIGAVRPSPGNGGAEAIRTILFASAYRAGGRKRIVAGAAADGCVGAIRRIAKAT